MFGFVGILKQPVMKLKLENMANSSRVCNYIQVSFHGSFEGQSAYAQCPYQSVKHYFFLTESMKCKAMMSTNILSYLLLHHFREGASMQVLIQAFKNITNNLLTDKIDVGFSGKRPYSGFYPFRKAYAPAVLQ